MGMITYIKDNTMMIIVTLFLRASQGFFRVFVQVPSFSIITIVHTDDRYKYLGIMESVMNFGSGIGPVIGSILYIFFGYFYMFIIMGLSFFIYLPLMIIFHPPNIDEDNEETTSLNNQGSSSDSNADISILHLLSNSLVQLL